jgi:AMP deaminase
MNYDFHKKLNNYYEEAGTKNDSADFITITKVDNHIHAASSMRRDEMLQFMKDKYYQEGDLIVTKDDEGDVTLKDSLNSMNDEAFDIERITTERLDMAASAKMFHRFDNFNDSYNPMGRSDLRSIFMKSSNLINGRFFAEVLREVVFKRIREQYHRVAIEPRLSIYGRKMNEWENLSKWFVDHKVLSCDEENAGKASGHVKWIIQVPRLCNIFMGKSYQSFEEMLRNIFQPIFEATLNPEENENIHIFLSNIGGFDCVDDESKYDPLMFDETLTVSPQDYKKKANPPYSYWSYYLYANIFVLNRLRESRGLNTFAFKPHCGEAGQRHHLATSYLLADSVNHGIKLQDEPTLQYLYYLSQIGLALCPLSNDALFLKLQNSPVGDFFKAGLRVCLGTDDPLQFHNTAQPLVEEYIVAQKIFTLSNTDMGEIARNSVLTSNFSHSWKKKWLGDNYHKASLVEANDVEFSNVGPVRPAFREDQLQRELNYIVTHGNLVAPLVGKEDDALDNTIEISNRNVICGAQPYLDKLGGAYESYRDKQTAEIKQITLQMKDL